MDELYNSGLEPAGQGAEEAVLPESVHNRHYVAVDGQGRIVDGWSDGPHPTRDTTGAICINEQGEYQFRLIYSAGFVGDAEFPSLRESEENPPLYSEDGIPLYKWGNGVAIMRTAEEMAADRTPPLETVQAAKLAELSAACSAAITGGCDVALPDGSAGHISLTAEDQINLTNAVAAVEGGAEAYPYHLDGGLCALYPAEAVRAMARAATAHKLYHTTYYNHLAAWVRRCGTAEEVQAVTYGAALPDDLAEHMAAILAGSVTMGGGTDAV